MRRTLTLAAFAGLLSIYSAVAAASEPVPDYVELRAGRGLISFVLPEGLFVTSSRLQAPEGEVEVVLVRPSDSQRGDIAGPSFVALTIFHSPLPGEGDQTEIARDLILNGVRASLRALPQEMSQRAITLAGQSVAAQRLSVRAEGQRVQATAGAFAGEGAIIVYFDQRWNRDSDFFARFNEVAETLSFGPAPRLGERAGTDDEDEDSSEHEH